MTRMKLKSSVLIAAHYCQVTTKKTGSKSGRYLISISIAMSPNIAHKCCWINGAKKMKDLLDELNQR